MKIKMVLSIDFYSGRCRSSSSDSSPQKKKTCLGSGRSSSSDSSPQKERTCLDNR